MNAPSNVRWRPRVTARVRLTLTYALFLVGAGAASLAIIYVVIRKVPSYPLTSADPRSTDYVPSRGEILGVLVNASGLALIVLGVVGLAAGWWISGRVLKPLQEINAAARRAADGSLDHRIGLTGPRDEFTDLSDTFDLMLDRLQTSFETQRRFAANASHELRTPLAITHTMLEVAQADPAGTRYPQLIDRLLHTNTRGIEIAEALMRLSRIGDTAPETEPVELARITQEALDDLADLAADRGIRLTVQLASAAVWGDHALLRQLITNLLHNAIRHNLDHDGLIQVSVGVAGDVAVFRLENTGPQLDPARVDELREPFMRGGGRVARGPDQTRGYGLGLGIADQIAQAHGGALGLRARSGGGLIAEVVMPRLEPRPEA